ADGDRRARPAQPLEVAPGFGVPDRDLETEAGGLGVDAVRPADRERVLVANCEVAEHLAQPLLARDQEIGRVAELERGGGVPDVIGGQADVDEPRVLAHLLLEAGQERDHLVLDALLDREDPDDVDSRLLPDAGHRVGGNAASPRVGLAHRQLHPEPRLVLGLLAPDPTHLRAGVAVDHALTIEQNRKRWKQELRWVLPVAADPRKPMSFQTRAPGDPRKRSRAATTTGSTSVGACPTPGTVTSSPFGRVATMRRACASERTSLSLPHTTRVGQVTRWSAGQSAGRGGAPIRTRWRMYSGSIFQIQWPSGRCLSTPSASSR